MRAMPLCQQGRFSPKEKRVLQFAGAQARAACADGYAAAQFAPYPAGIRRITAIADAANLFAMAFAIDTGRALAEWCIDSEDEFIGWVSQSRRK
ncbi:MAG: hypothetical protein DVS81_18465 [Candidatus Accumulibacter meliphilus]|uniref:Uncharacterized protein n=1 Tax=Candidatus Accumulibacter meliphilus TaxID=2211374 RepID=A0A369XNY8_9PROT|nr:MAG: hypothetical protein DVS81_18465 [Candidatus Accumulibacter meliphilus]